MGVSTDSFLSPSGKTYTMLRLTHLPATLKQSASSQTPLSYPAKAAKTGVTTKGLDIVPNTLNLLDVSNYATSALSQSTPTQSPATPQPTPAPAQSSAKPATGTRKNTFAQAWRAARDAGQETFTWNGQLKNTMKAGETRDQWKAYLTNRQSVQPIANPRPVTGGLKVTPEVAQPITNPQFISTTPSVAPETIQVQPQGTFNRAATRQYLRELGLNPNSFNGAQRKALRRMKNGIGTKNDALLVKEMGLTDLFEHKEPELNLVARQGGQLVSRNLIQRFKTRKENTKFFQS